MKYSGSLTREQFMFTEMRLTARLFLEGLSPREIEAKVYEDNLYQYPTEREIKSKCRACLKRLACLQDMPDLLEELANGTFKEARQAALIAMMLQSRLLAEFMVCVIAEKYRNLDLTLTKKDMNLFFQNLREQDEDVASWTDSTVNRIMAVIRNSLKESGHMETSRSTELLPVNLSDEFQIALKRAGHKEYLPAFNVFE